MTAHASTMRTLLCDGYDCYAAYRGSPDDPARQVRRNAKAAGWDYRPSHPTTGPPRDLCPKHAEDES